MIYGEVLAITIIFKQIRIWTDKKCNGATTVSKSILRVKWLLIMVTAGGILKNVLHVTKCMTSIFRKSMIKSITKWTNVNIVKNSSTLMMSKSTKLTAIKNLSIVNTVISTFRKKSTTLISKNVSRGLSLALSVINLSPINSISYTLSHARE